MALSEPRVSKKRRFIVGWEQEFFICKEDNKSVKCLICKKVLSGFLRANIKRHYDRYHASYDEMNYLERVNILQDLKEKNIQNEVKVVSGFYTTPATLVQSAAANVQLTNSDVALIKKNVSRAKTVQRARALKSAQAQENSGGEYDFSKKARTSTGSAETFIPKPGPSTMISGSEESSSLDIYDRTEKILGFSEPESQAETLTEGEFMEEKFLMTVKEEPVELPAEEAQAFPLEIQLTTSSAPADPELVDKKPITTTIETWPISNQGTETSSLPLPQAPGSIPTTSNLASALQSKPSPARRKKPCTITAEPTEESLALSLAQFPGKTSTVQDSSAKDVELDRTTQDVPVREPSIVYFGDESSKDDSDVCRLSAEDRSNVEAVLRRLRTEKLLLEIDKLKLEQKKLTAEKINILLKKSIFSLRKTLMSEDDDCLVQKTVSIVTPPIARVRDDAPIPVLLSTLGTGVSLHSTHEQVEPQTGLEHEAETGRESPRNVGFKQTKAIQSATSHSKENESQRITKQPTQKSAQNQQIAKDPLVTGGAKSKVAESCTMVTPTSEDVQISRDTGKPVQVLSPSSSSQRKTSGPKSTLHPGKTKTALTQPNQNLGTSSASGNICRVGLVAANQEASKHSETPRPQNLQQFVTPSYEYDNLSGLDSSGGSVPIADSGQWQTEDKIVKSDCDIVVKDGPELRAEDKRERNTGLSEIHGTESSADTRLSSGLERGENEGSKAGTSWLENAQARISKRFQQICQQESDPEVSSSKRMRMDDDDSVP